MSTLAAHGDDELMDLRLLGSQRLHGIDAGGAPGGEGGCQRCHEQEDEGHSDFSDGVEGGDTEEEGFYGAGGEPCSGQAGEDAEEDHPCGPFHDQLDDAAAGGAEGHANADFLAAESDGVGEDAVDADGGEQEGDGAEAGDEAEGQAALAEGGLKSFFHWLQLELGQIGGDALEGSA